MGHGHLMWRIERQQKTIPAFLCCGLRTESPPKNSACDEWEAKIMPATFIREPSPPFASLRTLPYSKPTNCSNAILCCWILLMFNIPAAAEIKPRCKGCSFFCLFYACFNVFCRLFRTCLTRGSVKSTIKWLVFILCTASWIPTIVVKFTFESHTVIDYPFIPNIYFFKDKKQVK